MTAKGNFTRGFTRRNILTNSEGVKNLAYKQLVHPVFWVCFCDFCDLASSTAVRRLEAIQGRAARLTCGIRRTDRKTSTTGLLKKLDLKSFSDRRLKVFSQYHHSGKTAFFRPENTHDSTSFHIPTPSTTNGNFFPYCLRWNAPPVDSSHLIPLSV